jgi:hypothetical protein
VLVDDDVGRPITLDCAPSSVAPPELSRLFALGGERRAKGQRRIGERA